MNAYPTEASARNIAVEFSTDDIAYFSTSTSTNRDEAFSQSQVPGMGCNEIGSKQAFGVYLHDAHGNWYPIYFDVTCTEQT